MKRILITGGCGFLGGAFVRRCLEFRTDDHVVNFDALTYASQRSRLSDLESEPRYNFMKGDLADTGAVSELFTRTGPFDVIFHFAAETHVDRSLTDARPFINSNVMGTQVLLDAFRKQHRGKLIHISTDEVYGPVPEGVSLREDAPMAPRNPYAATKAASDHLVFAAIRSFGIDACVVRSVNVYGPGQFPEKFIPLGITRLLEGRKIPLYGDGGQIRDWLYIDDYLRGVEIIESDGQAGEIYNLAAGDQRTNRQTAEMICATCNVKIADGIEAVDDRPGHDRRYALDASKARGLGWTPDVDFGRGLRTTVDYYRSRKPSRAPTRA